jgi:O-antigen ligase
MVFESRLPVRARPKIPDPLTSVIAAVPLGFLWLPDALRFGDFSVTYLVPFAITAWALWQPMQPNHTAQMLLGRSGLGLWIELSCASLVLVLAALSMTISPEPTRAFRVILSSSFGVCAVIALSRLPAARARRLVYGLLISGAFILIVSIAASRVPSLRSHVTTSYRLSAFSDNANQLSLGLIIFLPLALALALVASRPLAKLFFGLLWLVFVSALVLTAAKTAMGIGLCTMTLVLLYRASRTNHMTAAIGGLIAIAIILAVGIPATLWLISWSNPVAYHKIMMVATGGVVEYPSVQSRLMLWHQSFSDGIEHPLLGTGAGTHILGKAHSHNVTLDYFRGMGIGGAIAIITLLVTLSARTLSFYVTTFGKGREGGAETTRVAMYLGVLGYLIGNQMSDSLSPATAGLFWFTLVAAYCSAESDRSARSPRRPEVLRRPVPQPVPAIWPIPRPTSPTPLEA